MRLARFLTLGPHGFHRIGYTDWGDPSNARVVVCAHGLTRNSRDFDWLARELQRGHRVVCMDVAGRGESEWLQHKQDYTFRLYQADAAALIARVSARLTRGLIASWLRASHVVDDASVDWVGTSMGGLIGMLLAAQPGSPIRRLVLNDVGPFIPWSALVRIKGYMMARTKYATWEEAQALLRQACASWGAMSAQQWEHLTRHSIQRAEDGSYGFTCDPHVADATTWGFWPEARVGNRNLLGLDLWSVWDQVSCPVLILRGQESDVLQADTATRMQQRKAATELVEFSGVGHAPSLMAPEHIEPIRRFLSA